jgi:hypothetical protein
MLAQRGRALGTFAFPCGARTGDGKAKKEHRKSVPQLPKEEDENKERNCLNVFNQFFSH